MATTITAVPLYKESGLAKPYYGGHGPVWSPDIPYSGVDIPARPAGGMDGLGTKHDDLNPSMWKNGVPENQDATVKTTRSFEEHYDGNGNVVPGPPGGMGRLGTKHDGLASSMEELIGETEEQYATVETRSWEERYDSNGNIIPNPDMPKVDKRHSGPWVPVESVGEPETLDAAVEARSWEEFFDANGNIIPNPDMPQVDKKRSGGWAPVNEWPGDEEYNEEYPEVNEEYPEVNDEYPEVNVEEYPEVNVEENPEVNVEENPEVNVEEYPEEYYGEDVIPIPVSMPSSDE
ncbi:hypothetical protein LTR10_006471 [Elasticomyces elasticus]|nr:hypothetical protein LTR10_006471 [Elasticomyces elasticus]KAK4973132.1 hypothetical protein LTR42_006426 [Elasticomyces elasticus]